MENFSFSRFAKINPRKICQIPGVDSFAKISSSENFFLQRNLTKQLVEFFKEKNEKSREHEKALMQMQPNMQLQMVKIISQSHTKNSSGPLLADIDIL